MPSPVFSWDNPLCQFLYILEINLPVNSSAFLRQSSMPNPVFSWDNPLCSVLNIPEISLRVKSWTFLSYAFGSVLKHFWELSPLSVHYILASTTPTCFINSSYCTALPQVLCFVLFFSYLQLLFRLRKTWPGYEKHDSLAFFCYALQYNNIAPSNAAI